MRSQKRSATLKKWLSKPVIPVIWGDGDNMAAATGASAVFIQGGNINQLAKVLAPLETGPLAGAAVLVHLDLLAGVAADHAGVEYLASFPRIDGIITTRYQLVRAAHDVGLLGIVRLFLQDSRSLERGLKMVAANKPDLVEVLPGLASVDIAESLNRLPMPWIAGGMIRKPPTVRQITAAGAKAISTSESRLWRLNAAPTVR